MVSFFLRRLAHPIILATAAQTLRALGVSPERTTA